MLCKDLAYLVQQLGTRLFKGVQLSNDPALSPLVMCEHQRTCGRASQVLKFSCTLGMAVGPGGVKHLCYFVSVCLGQRLRCREVRQQCAGGRAGGREPGNEHSGPGGAASWLQTAVRLLGE